MQTTSVEQRRLIGCGFEPPHSAAMPWQPPTGSKGYQHGRPTVCVGYSMNLPEVIEVALARMHWEKGAIESYCQGQPSEQLLDGLAVLDSSVSEMQLWAMTPTKEGGGRE
jgi:hypothetical protein